jgi:hypothetical protein
MRRVDHKKYSKYWNSGLKGKRFPGHQDTVLKLLLTEYPISYSDLKTKFLNLLDDNPYYGYCFNSAVQALTRRKFIKNKNNKDVLYVPTFRIIWIKFLISKGII